MTERSDSRLPGGCESCQTDLDRRDFLRRAMAATAVALLGLGVPEHTAQALTPTVVIGRRDSSGTVRYPIPVEDGAQIDRENQVILVRWQGKLYAFNLSCPHQNTALRWNAGDRQFQCPKHKSRYQPDGTFVSGRATRGMDRLPISREADQVAVNLDQMFKETDQPDAWKAAALSL